MKNYYKFLPALLILVLLLLIVLDLFKNDYTPNSKSITKTALNTVVSITIYDTKSNKKTDKELDLILNKTYKELRRLELIFSSNDPDSELYKVNQKAFISPTKISPELFYIFKKSLYYSKLSNGAFDISIKNLIDLWNIGNASNVPSIDAISNLSSKENWKNIVLDEENMTVFYKSSDFKCDLGAIAKGYTADILKNFLKDNWKISNGLINLGGNILAIGSKPLTNESFRVGITNPLNKEDLIASINISDLSVVTSGNYERYFIKDGKRYHHILNPFTGYPSDNEIISATIIGKDSIVCDALSTTLFILGKEKALNLIEKIKGYECILIDKDLNFYKSNGIKDMNFQILSNTGSKYLVEK